MADVVKLRAAGATVVEMIYALKDGAGLDDIGEARALISAFMEVGDDIREDADSAGLEIMAGLCMHLATKRRG